MGPNSYNEKWLKVGGVAFYTHQEQAEQRETTALACL